MDVGALENAARRFAFRVTWQACRIGIPYWRVQKKRLKRGGMFRPWYQLTMLAIESQTVIALRLMKLSSGGTAAADEVRRMVSEKLNAAASAATTILTGGGVDKAIKDTRRHVRQNAKRLLRRR